jgi:hypothetical protein
MNLQRELEYTYNYTSLFSPFTSCSCTCTLWRVVWENWRWWWSRVPSSSSQLAYSSIGHIWLVNIWLGQSLVKSWTCFLARRLLGTTLNDEYNKYHILYIKYTYTPQRLSSSVEHLHQCSVCDPPVEILDEVHQSHPVNPLEETDCWDPKHMHGLQSPGRA